MNQGTIERETGIREYESVRYFKVRLISGDILGGEGRSFEGLRNEIISVTADEGIDKVVIDATAFRDIIDSLAIGGLAYLNRERDLTIYGLNPNLKEAVSRTTYAKTADTEEEALELMLKEPRGI